MALPEPESLPRFLLKGCGGCYYHDIARFVDQSPFEVARAITSQLDGEAELVAGARTGRMRSIQYLGAKTKLLPALFDSFDDGLEERNWYAVACAAIELIFGGSVGLERNEVIR